MIKGPPDKQALHKYKVWLLAKDQRPAQEKPEPATAGAAPASKQVSKLSDMETLLLLYSYGRPMEMKAESTCTLPNGQTTSCQTRKVSSEAIDFVYNEDPSDLLGTLRPTMPVGSPVSVDVEEVGAFKGVLTLQNEVGFQVAVNQDARGMVSQQLAEIAVKRGISVDATCAVKTSAARIEPKNKNCTFSDHTGTLRKGMIVNLSQYDALIRAPFANIPPMGSRIVLRGPEWHGGYVISVFEIGFIVKFVVPIPEDQFNEALLFA